MFCSVIFLLCGSPAVSDETREWLQPDWEVNQFSEVLIPSKFGVAENLIWGAKALFNHPDIKEIVPVYAYSPDIVCDRKISKESKDGVMIFRVNVETLEDNGHLASGKASWESSLEVACRNVDSNSSNNVSSRDYPIKWNSEDINTESWAIAAAKTAGNLAMIRTETDNTEGLSNDFILTIGRLPNVKPTGEFWWMCNDGEIPKFDTICYDTLAVSPYTQHKILVESSKYEAAQNFQFQQIR